MVKRILLLAGLITLLSGCINIPIPLGDGNKLMVGTDGISFVNDEDTEYSFDLDGDEGSISIDGIGEDGEGFTYSTGEDGNATVTFTDEDGTERQSQIGENLELTFELPEGIPLPNNANIYQQMDLGGQMLVNFSTEQPIDELKEFYNSYFSGSFVGGPIISDTGLPGYVERFTAATDDYEIVVQITGEKGHNESNVTINVYDILQYYGEDYDFDYLHNYDYDEDY